MKKVRSQAEKRVDSFEFGEGLARNGNSVSLVTAGSTVYGVQRIGGVYSVGRGIEIGVLGAGEISLKHTTYYDPSQYWYSDSLGGLRLGEGFTNITDEGNTRTQVDLGKGMEYEDIPVPENPYNLYVAPNDGKIFLYRKKIRPLLGNGLEFSEKTLTGDDGGTSTVYAIQPKLGNGLEFFEETLTDDDGKTTTVYSIQPKLGAGLTFSSGGALSVIDEVVGGGEYTAGTGIEISAENQIALKPAGASIGGVKAGEGVEIAADGTISVTGGSADISAGGGIEITTDDDRKQKIAVKCGEGCEIDENGALSTVPNIEYGIFISEADAKYLLHSYTQVEYIAGNKIGYADELSSIIINGYTAVRYGNGRELSAPIYQAAELTKVSSSGSSAAQHEFQAVLEQKNSDGSYSYHISDNGSSGAMNKTYDPATIGLVMTWESIYSTRTADAPYGYADLRFYTVSKPSAASTEYKSYYQSNYSGYYAFASEAEYNAAVGLTYEPLSLTQVNETTTVV